MAYFDDEGFLPDENQRQRILQTLFGGRSAPVFYNQPDAVPIVPAGAPARPPQPPLLGQPTGQPPTSVPPPLQPSTTTPAFERYEKLAAQPPPQQQPPEKRGMAKTILGAAGMGLLGGYPAIRDWLNRPEAESERKYKQATEQWKEQIEGAKTAADLEREQAAERRLETQAKPEKPEGLQQEYADAVREVIKRGDDPAKDPTVQRLADAITSLQRQPAAPKENKAVPGVSKGTQAWGLQTDTGWVDPQTRKPIPDFKPAPTFAETGLYEPVEVPVQGGGMAPGVFNRRTGQTTVTPPQKTPVPKEAAKQIDESLATARGMDRLEGAQAQLLQNIEKRGKAGPLGGGPYLNGPESMQFVANHIAMTFGSVKGARIGRDIIEQHVKARDLDQSTEAMAQQVLSGGVITYTQAQQMMDTARINRKQAWNQARQAAETYGIPDAVKMPADLSGAPKAKAAPGGTFKEF